MKAAKAWRRQGAWWSTSPSRGARAGLAKLVNFIGKHSRKCVDGFSNLCDQQGNLFQSAIMKSESQRMHFLPVDSADRYREIGKSNGSSQIKSLQ